MFNNKTVLLESQIWSLYFSYEEYGRHCVFFFFFSEELSHQITRGILVISILFRSIHTQKEKIYIASLLVSSDNLWYYTSIMYLAPIISQVECRSWISKLSQDLSLLMLLSKSLSNNTCYRLTYHKFAKLKTTKNKVHDIILTYAHPCK